MSTQFGRPYPERAPPVYWMVNPFTEHLIDDLRRRKGLADMGVAIIDLTLRARRADGSGWIGFAGWNMYRQMFAASLPKIAAMFAAFRLREQVPGAMSDITAKDAPDLLRQLTDDWKPVVQVTLPEAPPDFPDLARVFQIGGSTGAFTIRFQPDFWKHMDLMIYKSNNQSAAYCINAIGFQYLNGALAAEGLYSSDHGGLWLGANYQGRVWRREPKISTAQGATAKAVAAFLTLLEENRLVNAKASESMRQLMRGGSWFYEGLAKARPPRNTQSGYAKVGLFGTYHDCAVIERSTPDGVRLRYAIVGLGARSPADLHRLVIGLDDFIIACQ